MVAFLRTVPSLNAMSMAEAGKARRHAHTAVTKACAFMLQRNTDYRVALIKFHSVKLAPRALLHHCMAENNSSPATIALDEEAGEIVVRYGRPIEGLDKEELMAVVSEVADELDNKLADKFGCEMIGAAPT